MSLTEQAKQVYDLRNKKDELQALLSDIEQKLRSSEQELIGSLQEQGMSRVDVDGLGSFSLSVRRFFSIVNKDELIEFLHKNGDEDLLTVNHQTLNAYAKELKERESRKGNEDFSVPGTREVAQTRISLRKGKKTNGV